MRLAERLKADERVPMTGVPHLIIVARAGTGKTTTGVLGLRFVLSGNPYLLDGKPFKPTAEQVVIWNEIKRSKGAKYVGYVAYSAAIAAELKNRVPQGCTAMTCHSLGKKALMDAFPEGKLNKYRVEDLILETMGVSKKTARNMKQTSTLEQVSELVSLCKQTLQEDLTPEGLQKLANEYSLDIDDIKSGVWGDWLTAIPSILTACKDIHDEFDFDDMIWKPIKLNLPIFKYDLLVVDEAQDLNKSRQELIRRAGHRIILIGDPQQAIFGFTGADSNSMASMEVEWIKNGEPFETRFLNITQRCSQAVVKFAQQIVPELQPNPANPEGSVKSIGLIGYRKWVKPGSMILSRCNAPLISECYRFLSENRKAKVIGRDIGQKLVKLVKRMRADTVDKLLYKLTAWLNKTLEELRGEDDWARIEAMDKYDCLINFCQGKETTEEVIQAIEEMFDDNVGEDTIRLSSLHRSKGLEARDVYILITQRSPLPHYLAKTERAREQESNLEYVGRTRAILNLTYVKEQNAQEDSRTR